MISKPPSNWSDEDKAVSAARSAVAVAQYATGATKRGFSLVKGIVLGADCCALGIGRTCTVADRRPRRRRFTCRLRGPDDASRGYPRLLCLAQLQEGGRFRCWPATESVFQRSRRRLESRKRVEPAIQRPIRVRSLRHRRSSVRAGPAEIQCAVRRPKTRSPEQPGATDQESCVRRRAYSPWLIRCAGWQSHHQAGRPAHPVLWTLRRLEDLALYLRRWRGVFL